jgi:hypothetical protein
VLLRDDVSSQGIDPLEIEANAFASELLVPGEFLHHVYRLASALEFSKVSDLLPAQPKPATQEDLDIEIAKRIISCGRG